MCRQREVRAGWRLGFIATCLFLPTLTAAAADPLPADLRTRKTGVDWPSFLGPTGDSKSPETGILTKWPAGGPKIRWTKKLGTGYASCAISRGRLFQFDRLGNRAVLTCLKSETGEELWSFDYPTDYEDLYGYNNGPRCQPIVDDDRVYLHGVEGMLHCLRVEDGKLLWKVDTAAKFGVIQNFFGVGSTPAIEGNLLLVMVGGSPPEAKAVPPGQLNRVDGNGSGIVAFDKYTGAVKYQITDELASYASMKLATIAGRRWGFAFCRGGLVGFEPASGKVDFEYPWRASILESVNASTPVVVKDEVLITECYGPGSSLLKVAPGKEEVVWRDDPKKRQKAMQAHWMTPIYHDGYFYGSSGRHTENAELRCVEWKTGKVVWSVPDLNRVSLLSIDKHLLGLTEYGTLFLIKATPEKFDLVAEATPVQVAAAGPELPGKKEAPGANQAPLLKYPCWAAPIVSHGLLYVRGEDRLVCMELIPEKKNP